MQINKQEQYSLTKILTIWAMATLPMPVMAFWIAPYMAAGSTLHPLLVTWLFMVGGMMWQFILSAWLLYQELEVLTWTALCNRIWLKKPCDPITGNTSSRYFLWLLPAFIFYLAIEQTPILDKIGRLILIPFPKLESLPKLNLTDLPAEQIAGEWWLMAVAIVSCLFNYLLGEELLFRGILLPKMSGVFDRWDWAANSALFALYHLHRPLQMLGFIVSGMAWSWPSRYFRSIWFAIILHAIEGIPLLMGVYLMCQGGT